MPRGVFLSLEWRQLLFHHLITLSKAPKQVYNEILAGNDTVISLAGLNNLRSKMKAMNAAELEHYFAGPATRKHAGRKRKYDELVRTEFVNLRLEQNLCKLDTLIRTYRTHFVDPAIDTPIPSKATVSRILSKSDVVRKVVERRNIRADVAKQQEFLYNICGVHPSYLIDIDETLCNDEQFQQKYGWARRGDEAYGIQITIGGHNYSVIAAYTSLGFLCWGIYADSVSAMEFTHFLHHSLAGFVSAENIVLLDNASIHKTDEVNNSLEVTCQGNYVFIPPYSPRLKPIELGFSNIKRYLRENEADAAADPIGAINSAFSYYSVEGDGACAAHGNWSVYFANHEGYVNRNIEVV